MRSGFGSLHYVSTFVSQSMLTCCSIRCLHALNQDRRSFIYCWNQSTQRAMCVAQHFCDGFANWRERNSNFLITGFIKGGKPQHALMLCQKMQHDDFLRLSGPTCVALLKACAKLKDLQCGVKIHGEVTKTGLLKTDPFVGNTLVDM
eukprot:c26090_g1_i1 orf=2-439(-)